MLVAVVAAALLGGRARAQTFPPAGAYVPLTCGNNAMTDAVADTPGATGALDLVGTVPEPAGFHAADAQFLYLRMRVAATPLAGNNMLQANGWGFEFDLDGDLTTYELLISTDGIVNPSRVAIYRHTTVTRNDPADPAQTPPAFSYSFATHGRSIGAGSTLGGGSDAFIDIAVPWADLATVGVARDTPVYVWAGSSTVANALDLDLACFGAGGATLSGIDVGRTTPDPNAGGTGGTGRVLEGGLGCSVAARARRPSWLVGALVVVALALLRRRAFRSSR